MNIMFVCTGNTCRSPMAEGIFLKDKELYVLYESASDTYWMALPKLPKVLKYNLKEID